MKAVTITIPGHRCEMVMGALIREGQGYAEAILAEARKPEPNARLINTLRESKQYLYDLFDTIEQARISK